MKKRWLGRAVFVLSIALVGAPAYSGADRFCLNPQPKPNDFSPKEAVGFEGFDSFSDGQVATYLALINALSRVRLAWETPFEISGLDLIKGFKEIRTDRLILYLDVEKIKAWPKQGLKYSLVLDNGKIETGKMEIFDHSTKSAGLHCGYDLQWYTNTSKVPHLHWNVRYSDGQADIHLDRYNSWLWGFIPNPLHLSYQNSDVRFWFNKYKKKYGDPGFFLVNRKR